MAFQYNGDPGNRRERLRHRGTGQRFLPLRQCHRTNADHRQWHHHQWLWRHLWQRQHRQQRHRQSGLHRRYVIHSTGHVHQQRHHRRQPGYGHTATRHLQQQHRKLQCQRRHTEPEQQLHLVRVCRSRHTLGWHHQPRRYAEFDRRQRPQRRHARCQRLRAVWHRWPGHGVRHHREWHPDRHRHRLCTERQ